MERNELIELLHLLKKWIQVDNKEKRDAVSVATAVAEEILNREGGKQ